MNMVLPSERWLVLPVFLVLVLLATGCGDGDYRPHAIGPEGEILVVIDSTVWNSPVGAALRDELGYFIPTLPAPERSFELRPLQLHGNTLERIKRQKNVVFVAPIDDESNVGEFIRGRLPEGGVEALEAGGRIVAARPDLWRRHQNIYFISAGDEADLVSAIHEHGPALRDTFNVASRQRLTTEMYRRGRQLDIEQDLMERHGFAVNAQHDFVIAIDTMEFVWLRRILSDTWRSMFVHYVEDADPSLLSPDWALAVRDSLTQIHIQGNLDGWVEIDRRRPLEAEEIQFNGRFAYELRGLWHMVGEDAEGQAIQFGMGGPFVSYAFYDQSSGRLYLIDGMVFAPRYDKREFLRQMEAMAYTFRTEESLGADQVALAAP